MGWWVVGPPSDPPSEFILMGQGGIPNEMDQQTLGPPSDPPSRFPSWEGQSSILHASGYAEEDDLSAPPLY